MDKEEIENSTEYKLLVQGLLCKCGHSEKGHDSRWNGHGFEAGYCFNYFEEASKVKCWCTEYRQATSLDLILILERKG